MAGGYQKTRHMQRRGMAAINDWIGHAHSGDLPGTAAHKGKTEQNRTKPSKTGPADENSPKRKSLVM
jgi:hypothetical protein